MSRTTTAACAVLALALPATALAATPKSGATLKGTTKGQNASKAIPVSLKIAANGKTATFSITCDGETYSAKKVAIKKGKIDHTGTLSGAPLKLKATFKTAKSATGSFDTPVCLAGKPTFTAKAK